MHLDDHLFPNWKSWVEHQPACSVGTNPMECCRFKVIVHFIPHVNGSGATTFSCTRNFTDKENAWMCKCT